MLLFCSFISCVIIVSILFQFWNDRYIKSYSNKKFYIALFGLNIVVVMLVNMLMNPVLNLLVNSFFVISISYFFYYDDNSRKFLRVFESEALFVVIGVLEALGAYLLDLIFAITGIVPASPGIEFAIETAFSKMIVLFFYYAIFSRLWKKSMSCSKIQYFLYLLIFIYSIVNIFVTCVISNRVDTIVLMIIIGCSAFVDMYMLYFIRFIDERNYFKLQVEMIQQQKRLQYESCEMQRERYEEVVTTLHDVNKHIKMIEGLYQEDLRMEAINYTKQINDMLRPLLPLHYTDNVILNCLLFDKSRMAKKLGISMEIETSTADIDFMEQIDITTLFGNLLDNAINACKECQKEKYIGCFVNAYKEMVSIRVENTIFEPVVIKNGKIVMKGEGIGTLNIQRCVNAYGGSIIYKMVDNKLICDIVLNRSDSLEKEGTDHVLES